MNVLLVAEESAGIQALKSLHKSEHRIVAVMCSEPAKANGSATVHSVAKSFGYPVWPAKGVKDPHLSNRLKSERVDILLNIHSLYIINKQVLAAPGLGSFNMHPGPLPRYAGLNAVSWALYRGEPEHGVTIHKMEPGIDAGPIAYQSLFRIEESDTALSLSIKCIKRGLRLVEKLLDVASSEPNQIPLIPQDLTQREYFGKEVPNDGCISWSTSARSIMGLIRACDYLPFPSPWGFPRARFREREMGILKACRTGERCNSPAGTVGRVGESGVLIATGDEWILASRVFFENASVDAAQLLKEGDRLEDGHK